MLRRVPDHEKYKVGLIQMKVAREPSENIDRAVHFVAEAARAGARMVCLPELFQSQYFCQTEDVALFDLAEPSPARRPRPSERGAADEHDDRCAAVRTPGAGRLPTASS
jgi:N-carbamoylputrescine amidase